MALPFDIDIYNWLLVDILKVQPTGDPVNDSIYLVLLPMVVLYLFVHSTIHNSRFGTTKVHAILMFVVAFFIVRQGYYSIFAAFSLPLLIIIVLWNSVGFIFGRKKSYSGARGDDMEDYGDHDISVLRKVRNAVESTRDIPNRIKHEISSTRKADIDRLVKLDASYVKYEEDLQKVIKRPEDRSSGHIMAQIDVQEKGIVQEANGLRMSINDDSIVKEKAPNLRYKLTPPIR